MTSGGEHPEKVFERLRRLSEIDMKAKELLLKLAEKRDPEAEEQFIEKLAEMIEVADIDQKERMREVLRDLVRKKNLKLSDIDLTKVRQAGIPAVLFFDLEELLRQAQSYNELLAIVHTRAMTTLAEKLSRSVYENYEGDDDRFAHSVVETALKQFPEEWRPVIEKHLKDMLKSYETVLAIPMIDREKKIHIVMRDFGDAHGSYIVIDPRGSVEINVFQETDKNLEKLRDEGWMVYFRGSSDQRKIPTVVRLKRWDITGSTDIERIERAMEHVKRAVKHFRAKLKG